MDYANRHDIDVNRIPGIIAPQTVYTVNGQPPPTNFTRLTFFVNGVAGLRLQNALQPTGLALDHATTIPVIPPAAGQRASLRILVRSLS